jgi:RNA 3'-terminal phosphate cyclase
MRPLSARVTALRFLSRWRRPRYGGNDIGENTHADQHCLRGERIDNYAESVVAGVPAIVAQRELATIGDEMAWPEAQLRIRGIDPSQGAGNVVMITLAHKNVTEVFAAFGHKGVPSEAVAKRVID